MNRRDFLRAGLALSTSGAALFADETPNKERQPGTPFAQERSKLKIESVRMVQPKPRRPLPAYEPAPGSWSTRGAEVANPMSIYPRYKAQRSLFMADDLGLPAVEITTDKGISGIGYGGPGAGYVIEKHLIKLLLGEDPFNVEQLWDIMWRSTLYYGRKGMAVHAISAVDNALWDLIGKALGMPVYKLLGGETKARIPAYCTGNDLEQHVEFGFKKLKLAVPYGPADGREGMKKNVELVKRARDLLGPDGAYRALHARICRSARTVPRLLDGGMPAARRLRGLSAAERGDQIDAHGHGGTRVHAIRLPPAAGVRSRRHLAARYELVRRAH
jgi:hypothetical protein